MAVIRMDIVADITVVPDILRATQRMQDITQC